MKSPDNPLDIIKVSIGVTTQLRKTQLTRQALVEQS